MTKEDLEYTIRLSQLEYIAKKRGISLEELTESDLNYLRNYDKMMKEETKQK